MTVLNRRVKTWHSASLAVLTATSVLLMPSLYAEEAEYRGSFRGHEGAIHSLSFSKDGTWLLSGGTDGKAFTWDLAEWSQSDRVARDRDEFYATVLFPNGQHLLTAGEDQNVRVWDVEDGDVVRTYEDLSVDQIAAAVSPDGSLFCTSGEDNIISVFVTDREKPIHLLIGHTAPVLDMAFSPDGNLLATVSLDGKLKLWEVATGYLTETYDTETPLHAVSYSPDGRSVAVASNETIKIMEITTGETMIALRGHTGKVNALAFSPNGKTLLSGGADRAARLWSTTTGREIKTFLDQDGAISAVAFSPDGRYVATGSMKRLDEESRLVGEEVISVWDVTETYTDNRISNFVEKELYYWQKKGEFEKRAAYEARMKRIDRKCGELFSRAFAANAEEIAEETVLSGYDPEKEQFVLRLPALGSLTLHVPIEKAPAFRDNFSRAVFRNFVVVPHVQVPHKSTWKVKTVEVFLPFQKQSFVYGDLRSTPGQANAKKSTHNTWKR